MNSCRFDEKAIIVHDPIRAVKTTVCAIFRLSTRHQLLQMTPQMMVEHLGVEILLPGQVF